MPYCTSGYRTRVNRRHAALQYTQHITTDAYHHYLATSQLPYEFDTNPNHHYYRRSLLPHLITATDPLIQYTCCVARCGERLCDGRTIAPRDISINRERCFSVHSFSSTAQHNTLNRKPCISQHIRGRELRVINSIIT